jgi:hypothetical protein
MIYKNMMLLKVSAVVTTCQRGNGVGCDQWDHDVGTFNSSQHHHDTLNQHHGQSD